MTLRPHKLLSLTVLCLTLVLANLSVLFKAAGGPVPPITGRKDELMNPTATPFVALFQAPPTQTLTSPLVSPTPTANPITATPGLAAFIEEVADGAAGVIRGVYVEDVLSLHVVQQPANDVAFVSSRLGIATQFSNAARNGVTGLLAHNYLSGLLYYRLVPGQVVSVIYGDGNLRHYRVSETYRFQKLTPSSLHSEFIDLQTQQRVTTDVVFNRFYSRSGSLTFQTCLEKDGLSNWGLLFVTADPIH